MEGIVLLVVVYLLALPILLIVARFRRKVGNALAWAGLPLGACIYFAWIVSYFRTGFSNGVTGSSACSSSRRDSSSFII